MWRNSTRTLNPVRGKDNEQPLDDILHIKGSSNSIVFLKHWVTSALDSDPWLTGFLFLIPILQSPTRSQRDQHALLWRIIVREMSLVGKAHQNNERYVFLWAPESVSCERLASEACRKWKTYVSVGTFSRVFSNPFLLRLLLFAELLAGGMRAQLRKNILLTSNYVILDKLSIWLLVMFICLLLNKYMSHCTPFPWHWDLQRKMTNPTITCNLLHMSPLREIGRRFCQLEAITENDPIPYTLFTIVQHAYIFTEVHSIAFPSKY